SLSISLGALVTETSIELDPALPSDTVELDGSPATGAARDRVVAFLDLVRARANIATRAHVRSTNRFPTASGLASSASGFAARAALAAADLPALGAIAEANALAMHATAIAARPAIVYWRPETLAVLARVRALRDAGRAAWATIDAGPHVKVLTDAADAEPIA